MTATADWLLGPGVQAAHLDASDEENISFEVTSVAHTAGSMTGILGFMRAHLDVDGGVCLTNDPTDPGHFRRWQVYHPIEPAIEVAPGDEVDINFEVNQRGHLTTWRVRVGDQARFASQFLGDFLDPLVMFDPPGNTVPPLRRAGQCRRAVLDAIATGQPFAQIVEVIVTDFSDQFPDADKARRFARDMVARYCERA